MPVLSVRECGRRHQSHTPISQLCRNNACNRFPEKPHGRAYRCQPARQIPALVMNSAWLYGCQSRHLWHPAHVSQNRCRACRSACPTPRPYRQRRPHAGTKSARIYPPGHTSHPAPPDRIRRARQTPYRHQDQSNNPLTGFHLLPVAASSDPSSC